ncbi:helix-turn-helix domain-containing protein [Actinomadura rayongensis]|uniref:Helix-turn-helix domain-containing protein n=1 Tax=Actinomadura rayongensis TaxID=1429076 RepID=A0A6I4W7D4_9ACTN|nr:helix-turn-helix transcriptional regulator [Actinomadura rayongensis]MXQ64650.1 helix-turn-helix domain-containing protein [Actinomadura rayongensis]
MSVERRPRKVNMFRLGMYLQHTREFLELSYEQAAERAGCDVEWLIRVEEGLDEPAPERVRHILERYGVIGARIAEVMIDLAYRPDGPSWLDQHAADISANLRDVLVCEAEATIVRSYRVRLIPELLRTEEYERRIAADRYPRISPDVAWDILDHRQRLTPGGRSRRIDAMLDEAVLKIPVGGPQVMIGQLRHLLDVTDSPDITLRVAPFDSPAFEERAHDFDVFEFFSAADRVSVAHISLGAELAPKDLLAVWEEIDERAALSPDESRVMIESALADFTARHG